MNSHIEFMSRAIELASENVRCDRGGPFGTVVVKDGVVFASGTNLVTATNDPTAHAEIVAIREACRVLGTFQLTGCSVYANCEPCPMCLGALYWARPVAVYYANTQQDAAAIGFDDSAIYHELAKPPQERRLRMKRLRVPEALESFRLWSASQVKVEY